MRCSELSIGVSGVVVGVATAWCISRTRLPRSFLAYGLIPVAIAAAVIGVKRRSHDPLAFQLEHYQFMEGESFEGAVARIKTLLESRNDKAGLDRLEVAAAFPYSRVLAQFEGSLSDEAVIEYAQAHPEAVQRVHDLVNSTDPVALANLDPCLLLAMTPDAAFYALAGRVSVAAQQRLLAGPMLDRATELVQELCGKAEENDLRGLFGELFTYLEARPVEDQVEFETEHYQLLENESLEEAIDRIHAQLVIRRDWVAIDHLGRGVAALRELEPESISREDAFLEVFMVAVSPETLDLLPRSHHSESSGGSPPSDPP